MLAKLWLVVIGLVPWLLPQSGFASDSGAQLMQVDKRVNLRTGAGKKFRVKQVLTPGSRFKVLNTNSAWVRVYPEDTKSFKKSDSLGFLFGKLLRPVRTDSPIKNSKTDGAPKFLESSSSESDLGKNVNETPQKAFGLTSVPEESSLEETFSSGLTEQDTEPEVASSGPAIFSADRFEILEESSSGLGGIWLFFLGLFLGLFPYKKTWMLIRKPKNQSMGFLGRVTQVLMDQWIDLNLKIRRPFSRVKLGKNKGDSIHFENTSPILNKTVTPVEKEASSWWKNNKVAQLIEPFREKIVGDSPVAQKLQSKLTEYELAKKAAAKEPTRKKKVAKSAAKKSTKTRKSATTSGSKKKTSKTTAGTAKKKKKTANSSKKAA